MEQTTIDTIRSAITDRMARLGDQWRTAAHYDEPQPDITETVQREMLAAERLGRDLTQDADPVAAGSAALALMRGLYADQLREPWFWGSVVGRRVAWIMPIPGETVPAAIAAAVLDLSRQRVWQLVGTDKLAAVDLAPESASGKMAIDTLSLFRLYNRAGTLAGQVL